VAIAAGVAVLVMAVAGYLVAGSVAASGQIATADKALNAAIDHEGRFDTAASSISSQFGAIDLSQPSAPQFQSGVDGFVKSWTDVGTQVRADDSRLSAAGRNLSSMAWLTVFSRGSLDAEAARIGHARKALAAARTLTDDFLQDGQFLEALAAVLTDLTTISTDSNQKDYVAALGQFPQLKAHVNTAISLSSAPGLPDSLHTMLLNLQKSVTDLAALYDAYLASDKAAYDSALANLTADSNALKSFSGSEVASSIQSFYQPIVATYHAEMLQAAP
jgi:hypothetical protein